MQSRSAIVFGIALWVAAAGCATSARDGSNPRVSREDIAAAQRQSGWGKAITVTPEQIFEPR